MIFSQREISLEDFDTQNLQCFHYVNDEDWKINVFFAISDAETISNKWKGFSDTIASIYQNSDYMSNKEFDKWNFYVIYISKEKLSKEIKNKIENDRFSSRKIVEDLYDNEFSNEEANDLIVRHITNTDLNDILSKTQDKIREEYNPISVELWNLVHNDVSLGRDTDLQKQIVEQIIKLSNEN